MSKCGCGVRHINADAKLMMGDPHDAGNTGSRLKCEDGAKVRSEKEKKNVANVQMDPMLTNH